MPFNGARGIETALNLLGELLQARGESFNIIIVGGAAVNLLGFVSRATTDVDILAFAHPDSQGKLQLSPPDDPLPGVLVEAARVVATDLSLDPNWLNTGPASQWQSGIPPGLEKRISWRSHGGLSVGIVGRRDLIFLKLYAAVDDTGPTSVHFQDLIALRPTKDELAAAAVWVQQQDPTPIVAQIMQQVIDHANSLRAQSR